MYTPHTSDDEAYHTYIKLLSYVLCYMYASRLAESHIIARCELLITDNHIDIARTCPRNHSCLRYHYSRSECLNATTHAQLIQQSHIRNTYAWYSFCDDHTHVIGTHITWLTTRRQHQRVQIHALGGHPDNATSVTSWEGDNSELKIKTSSFAAG